MVNGQTFTTMKPRIAQSTRDLCKNEQPHLMEMCNKNCSFILFFLINAKTVGPLVYHKQITEDYGKKKDHNVS